MVLCHHHRLHLPTRHAPAMCTCAEPGKSFSSPFIPYSLRSGASCDSWLEITGQHNVEQHSLATAQCKYQKCAGISPVKHTHTAIKTDIRNDADKNRQAGRRPGRQGDRQTGRHVDRETNRQIDRKIGGQAGRQADRQTVAALTCQEWPCSPRHWPGTGGCDAGQPPVL